MASSLASTRNAVDIIERDLQKTGGLSEGWKIATWRTQITRQLRRIARHRPSRRPTAHVCASIPNFLACEWHWINFLDLWKNWVKEAEIIRRVRTTVTDKPGLGVEMNEEVARKAQIPGTTWVE